MCLKHTYNFDMERYEVVLALAEAVGDTYSALRTWKDDTRDVCMVVP